MEPHPKKPDDAPPWMQPGQYRRDGEPHRGGCLGCIATLGIVPGFVALLMSAGCFASLLVRADYASFSGAQRSFGILTALFSLLSLPGSVVAWRLAENDLAEIKRRERDPAGEEQTANARHFAESFAVLNLLSFLFGVVTWLVGEMGP